MKINESLTGAGFAMPITVMMLAISMGTAAFIGYQAYSLKSTASSMISTTDRHKLERYLRSALGTTEGCKHLFGVTVQNGFIGQTYRLGGSQHVTLALPDGTTRISDGTSADGSNTFYQHLSISQLSLQDIQDNGSGRLPFDCNGDGKLSLVEARTCLAYADAASNPEDRGSIPDMAVTPNAVPYPTPETTRFRDGIAQCPLYRCLGLASAADVPEGKGTLSHTDIVAAGINFVYPTYFTTTIPMPAPSPTARARMPLDCIGDGQLTYEQYRYDPMVDFPTTTAAIPCQTAWDYNNQSGVGRYDWTESSVAAERHVLQSIRNKLQATKVMSAKLVLEIQGRSALENGNLTHIEFPLSVTILIPLPSDQHEAAKPTVYSCHLAVQ